MPVRSLTAALCVGLFLTPPVAESQVISVLVPDNESEAAEPLQEDIWIMRRDAETGDIVREGELTLTPRAESIPALKHRLLPADPVEGNAALFYLKALGFLEQSPARQRIDAYHEASRKRAEQNGGDVSQEAPHVWLTTPPGKLPIKEVDEYLSWHSFQESFMEDAWKRKSFDLNRRIREVENPIYYLLPEIQVLRQLARTQSLRTRLALAEGRTEDALRFIGQQYALAQHLGQDEFLISNLVGVAILAISYPDTLYLLQMEDAPNLYWAFAALPDPVVDMRGSMLYESQFLLHQLPAFRKVDEERKPAGYWDAFADELLDQLDPIGEEFGFSFGSDQPDLRKAEFATFAAMAYPGARQYLIDREILSVEEIESYEALQIVFLAMRRYYEEAADEALKWQHVPHSRLPEVIKQRGWDVKLDDARERYGWITAPANYFLPAMSAVRTAQLRVQQNVAVLQTIESIRAQAAKNGGKLPDSLTGLDLPVPDDPFTGEPLKYTRDGDSALIECDTNSGIAYRFTLRIAQP